MRSNHIRIVLALLLTAVLGLTLPAAALTAPMSLALEQAGVPTPGVSSYNEDFTTTAYRAGSTTAAGWGTGTVTSPRDYTVTQLDFYSISDPVRGVAVQDRKAYVITDISANNGLRILNITDPRTVTFLGMRGPVSDLLAVKVDGDVAYVGSRFLTSYCWLGAYNVTNPRSIPGPLDTATFVDGDITDLDLQGHFLYIAINGASGDDLAIVDVEDPTDFTVVGGIAFSDLYGVDVEGQLAYCADGVYGLYVYNVSNPYVEALVGWRNTPGNSTDVLVDGTLAYVADGAVGVQIIDVSTPSSPVILATYNTPGEPQRLALQGRTLFVADGVGGLQVVDVANPMHPCNVTAVTLPYTYDVALYGGDLVVATASGVYTLRLGSGFTALPLYTSYGGGYEYWDVRVRGDIAYVAAGPDGLLTFNVSDPANIVLLDQYSAGVTFCRKLDVQGHLAFVADYGDGLRVFDVSDPTNIELTDTFLLTYSVDVCVAGEVAYVADGTYGVYIVNASNPYSLVEITHFDPGTENVTAVCVQGYHLYVVTQVSSGEGLLIYDITDIGSPTLVFSWTLVDVNHYDIFVDGDSVYTADGGSGGYVVHWNVTNPFNAYYSDAFPIGGNPTGVWGFGPYLLTTRYGSGVSLINATNINDLTVIWSHPGPKAALQVTVHGDCVYVANRSSLVTHRLFRSAGATYVTGSSVAESLTVDATSEVIVNATLSLAGFLPTFTGITWQLSADGGAHWEAVTPDVLHTFTNTGSDLRWRATFTTSHEDRSAHLYGVSITYGHTVITSLPPPIPGFPAAAIAIGAALSLGLVLALRQRKSRKQ